MPGCGGAMTGVVHGVPKKSSPGLGTNLLPLYQSPPRTYFHMIILRPLLYQLSVISSSRKCVLGAATAYIIGRCNWALKKMKDGAPGPDGRRLSDVQSHTS